MQNSVTLFILQFVEMARHERYFHIATTTFKNLYHIPEVEVSDKLKITFEESQLYWAKNDKRRGLHILKQLLNLEDDNPEYVFIILFFFLMCCYCILFIYRIKSSSLKLYGAWIAEMHSQSPWSIISDYFLKSIYLAVNAVDNLQNREKINETYYVLAKFADQEYQQVCCN